MDDSIRGCSGDLRRDIQRRRVQWQRWPAVGRPHLYEPSGVAYDPTTSSLYIADTFNNEIRGVAAGIITDWVGSPVATPGFSPDGSPPTSPIDMPHSVRLDGAGNLFFDEVGNDLVRDVPTRAGAAHTIAGTPHPPPGGAPFPYSGLPATTVSLNSPHGLAIIPTSPTTGDVWVSDTNNNVVDSVTGVAAGAGADTGDNVACIPNTAGVGTCPNPPDQPGGIDHYLCYHVANDSAFAPQPVSLTDQFGTDQPVLPTTAPGPAVTDDSQMCNPVTKVLPSGVSYPAQNPYLHQLCFPDSRTTPNVSVTVQNRSDKALSSSGQQHGSVSLPGNTTPTIRDSHPVRRVPGRRRCHPHRRESRTTTSATRSQRSLVRRTSLRSRRASP